MKKKPTLKAKAKLSAECEFFASFDANCPLCGALVPAKTQHACSKQV